MEFGATDRVVNTYTGCELTAPQLGAFTGPAPVPIGVPGRGGAPVPQAGGGWPPLLLELEPELEPELELLLELELDPVPTMPVLLEPVPTIPVLLEPVPTMPVLLEPVPTMPVELELLELLLELELLELELLELELELLLDVPVVLPVVELLELLEPDVLVPPVSLLVEVPEVVVALACELLPCPVEPPSNIAIAMAS